MRRAEQNAGQRRARDHQTITVLLADDDACVRNVICSILESGGFSVHAVADGNAAIEALYSSPDRFDIAVLDYRMPLRDGQSALEEMRLLRPDLPAVIISGYDAAVTDVTNVEFLQKPFNRSSLLASLHRVLERVTSRPRVA